MREKALQIPGISKIDILLPPWNRAFSETGLFSQI